MESGSYQFLRVERDGHVLTVTFNRPDQMNGISGAMEAELCRAIRQATMDVETRVVVLTGAGKAFSAGGDFDYINEMIDEPSKFWDGMNGAKQLISTLLDCPKPIIAKINGHAIGLGATIALFCDVTFAAEHAKIGDPHVAIGFVAGDGGAIIWPQLAGFNRAKEYLLTGEAVPAPEAARLGLLNHCVPAAELDAAVDAYVRKLLAVPSRAQQWTKCAINVGLKQLAHTMMDASIAYEALSNHTRDHREAMAAIAEKRKPKFDGN